MVSLWLAGSRESMAEERARLKALRANDMEGYKKLLEKTKNNRLVYLMEQTDEYLKNLGACTRSGSAPHRRYTVTPTP